MLRVRDLTVDDAPACDAIVASLPTFFGDPDGIRECAEAVRTQVGWVASDDDVVVGFVTIAPSSDESPRSRGWASAPIAADRGSDAR